MTLTRRRLLRNAALLPILAATGRVLEGCGNSEPVCANPEFLSTGERKMRETLAYIERAQDASEQCGGCQFFAAGGGHACGHCQILNGAVSRLGHCSSWAAT